MDRQHRQKWHEAINRHHAGKREHLKWMYEAKNANDEVPRLVRLFGRERRGELPKIHQQCSRSAPEPVAENYLTCCLGVRCSGCEPLKALDAMDAPPEAIDEAKAWTCATHIISEGGDPLKEGYLLTVDDKMFWERVYSSLSMEAPDE